MEASDYRALNASLHYSVIPVLQSFLGVMKERVESSKHWQEQATKSTRDVSLLNFKFSGSLNKSLDQLACVKPWIIPGLYFN
jgi:hypothetical protein